MMATGPGDAEQRRELVGIPPGAPPSPTLHRRALRGLRAPELRTEEEAIAWLGTAGVLGFAAITARIKFELAAWQDLRTQRRYPARGGRHRIYCPSRRRPAPRSPGPAQTAAACPRRPRRPGPRPGQRSGRRLARRTRRRTAAPGTGSWIPWPAPVRAPVHGERGLADPGHPVHRVNADHPPGRRRPADRGDHPRLLFHPFATGLAPV